MKKLAVLFLAAGIAAGFLGCSKSSPTNTTTTVTRSVVVWAGFDMSRSPPYTDFRETADIFSDPGADPAQCSAQMKFGSTAFVLPREDMWGLPGYVSFYDTLPFPYPGITCSVFVTTNLGACRAGGVSLPGSYRITAPQMDTLPWGDLAVAWTQAQNAAWYDVWVYFTALDTITGYIGSDDTTLFATGTSANVSQAFLRKYSNAHYIVVNTSVDAHAGPMPGAGAVGNMAGDLKGFFISTFSDSVTSSSCYMGTQGVKLGTQTPSPQISKEKRREAILKAFGAPMKSEVK
jgi:hypothetical protein